MSIRLKKSAMEAFKEKGLTEAKSPGKKKRSSDASKKGGVVHIATPAKSLLPPEDDYKKGGRGSSLRKIKKFLGSHSKKKQNSSGSSAHSPISTFSAKSANLQLKLFEAKPDDTSKSESSSKSASNSHPKSMLPPSKSQKVGKQKKDSDPNGSLNGLPAKRLRLSPSTSFSTSGAESGSSRSPSVKEIIKRSEVFSSKKKENGENTSTSKNSSLGIGWEWPLPNVVGDSVQEASKLFEFLIQPVTPAKFFKDIWEKKPLLVRRHNLEHNTGLFSTSDLDRILREESVRFSEHIDVVTYIDGKRETHNPGGRAFAGVVWDYYQQGCSVRLLNPHTYCESVWKVLSLLQEYFSCMAGANVYLTPPGTQGFAPHWDDIEAFVIQLEGKKHWRVYEPRNDSEVLPRFSSPNFVDADLTDPVLDVILEAGDLLYFPRGYIHQGRTLDDSHSLHITMSVGQKNTWGDLLEKLVPRALEIAIEEDVEFRRSLPRDYLNYMGVAFSDSESPERQRFMRMIESLMTKLCTYAPVDGAVDQMSKKFLSDSLPPFLTDGEKDCSIHKNGEKWSAAKGGVVNVVELEPDTEIKIIRRGSVRLVSEEKVFIYHNLENARVYQGNESAPIDIDPDEAPAVEFLLNSYPDFVKIEDLPIETQQKQIELASCLYNRGLIVTRKPLQPFDESDGSDSEHSSLAH